MSKDYGGAFLKPKKLKDKFAGWRQSKRQNRPQRLFVMFSLLLLWVFITGGFTLDEDFSSAQTDYNWFQRSGAVAVGMSIFIAIFRRSTLNSFNKPKASGAPSEDKDSVKEVSGGELTLDKWLSALETFTLFLGTFVGAFGDTVTNRFLHCGQWMCA